MHFPLILKVNCDYNPSDDYRTLLELKDYMTLSAEQFRNHLVWTSLSDLGPLIDQAMAHEGLDAQSLEELARLKSVLSFTGKRLAGADPYLFQPSILDAISSGLTTSTTQVRNFIASSNVAHLPAANLEADKALTALSQLNVPMTTEDFVAAKEAAENYRLSFNKIFGDIQTEATQIHTDIESLKSQLATISADEIAIKQQLVALTPEHQKQFDAAQAARLAEWTEEQEAQKEQFESLVTQYETALTEERQHLTTLATENQTQFAATQEAHRDEWEEAQKNRQTSFDSLITEYTDTLKAKGIESTKFQADIETLHTEHLDKMRQEFAGSSSKIRDEILELKREADVLVGIIGDRGVTSGHQKAAEQAREDALLWQRITVGSMVLLIGLAIFIFLPQLAGTFTWESFAGRVFITFTVGVLAAYAGSQADKYQKIERYSKNLALELQAIGPYIAPLPQDKQDEFRLKIGDRTFGREGGIHHKSDEKSPTSVADVINKSKDLSGFTTDIIKTTAEIIKRKE